MKVNNNLGIDPVYWGEKKLSEFLDHFEGKNTKDKLKQSHKECVKQFKNKK